MTLLVLLSILFAIPSVQTHLARLVTNNLNKTYKTNILIDKVDLSYLGNIQLKGIHIKDFKNAKMIDINNLSTSLFNLRKAYNNKLEFDKIDLHGVRVNMITYKGDKDDNITIFSDKFDDGKPTTTPSSFLMTTKKIILNDAKFYLYDYNFSKKPLAFYKQIKCALKDFKIKGPNVSAKIRNLQFVDNHALDVKQFDTEFKYTLTGMQFYNTKIKTKTSALSLNLNFDYKRKNLQYFYDSVQVKAVVKKSKLSIEDLKNFYGKLHPGAFLNFTTKIKGTLNNFKMSNLNLVSNNQTKIKGNFELINSFKDKAPFKLVADVKSLSSNSKKLKEFLPNLLGKNLPSTTNLLGNFSIDGKTTITNKNINTLSKIKSDIGNINVNLDFNNITKIDSINYNGTLNVVNFELGKILKDSLVGKFSMQASIDGSGFNYKFLNTSVNGIITKHQYKNYTYRNIAINGIFTHQKLTGKLISKDPNIKMNIAGYADFSKEINSYNFITNMHYVNFKNLNLFKRDKISLLKGSISFNMKGNTLDQLIGQIDFKNTTYTSPKGVYFFKNFRIKSANNKDVRTIEVNSTDIINGKLNGNFKLLELPNLFVNGLGSLLSQYQYKKVTPNQSLKFNFKLYNKIVEIFYPGLILAPKTFIRGNLATKNNSFTLNFKSPRVKVFKNTFNKINLQIDNKNPLFNTLLSVNKIKSDYYNISKVNLVNVKLKDTLFLRTNFYGGDSLTEKYSLSLYNTINKEGKSVFGLKKSTINVKNINWILNPSNNKENKIIFDNNFKSFNVKKIVLISGNQKVDVEGTVKDKNNKDLQLNLKNVAIQNITPNIDSLALKGIVNGNLNIKQVKGVLMPITDMTIDNFIVNKSYQGNIIFNAQGFNTLKKYELNLLINRNDVRSLYAKGAIDFRSKKPKINVDILLNKFKLNAFSPLGENVLSNIRGYASGHAKVWGNLENPFIDGELGLTNAGLKFPYINVDYNFEGNPKIKLYKHTFEFLPTFLVDNVYKTRAKLTGTISHERFKKWFLNLKLDTDNLLVLNTKEDEEKLYYGTGFIDGQATITGITDNLLINVNGKTNKGTKFIIPLSDVRSIDDSNLIEFVNKEKNLNKNKANKDVIVNDLQGLRIRFNLDVTKDAIAQIVVDKKTGSILKGSGDGNLQININTNGNFTMFGDFIVDNGVYKFKNIINKSFDVKKGGTIKWTGNPYNANLNIEAIYHTKANPAVLLENVKSTRNVDVDLLTHIQGKLYESNMQFDVSIPNASSTVNNELQFKLNDNDKKMTQFFALLTTGMFISQNNANFDSNAAITGTISERISGVLSDILNKEGNKFQIGVNYDVGNSSKLRNYKTDDQIEMTFSSKINKRFTVNGAVGVPVGAKTQSNIVGEVEISTPLNKSGSLKGRVFNRQNQIQFAVADQEGYTQGLGLSYRVDFNNLKDLFKKSKKNKKIKKDSLKNKTKLIQFESVKKDSIRNKN